MLYNHLCLANSVWPGIKTVQRFGFWNMHILKVLAVATSLVFFVPALAQKNDDSFDPISIDITDAINCNIDAPGYNSLALSISEDMKRRGWKKIKSANPFMSEYLLAQPITVAGMQTSHIAFSSSAVMAVLDLADPNVVAKAEDITNDADPAALFEDLKLTPEQIKEIPKTDKFLGQKILTDVTEKDAELNMQFHTVIARTISNVASLPKKTLYGCSYRIEVLDAEGKAI
jgi:hypothetical protein